MKWGLAAALAGCVIGLTTLSSLPVLARAGGQGVTSENATVTRDALAVLHAGGSAADAAITAALVAGVAAPTSSGLGGGGFALFYDAEHAQTVLLDFREVAPSHIDASVFERRPLAVAESGHLVGVPGEARGLFELHRRAGKLGWAKLVKRAEERAQNGFLVSPHLANMLGKNAGLASVPGLAAVYFPKGKPAAVGVRLTNPRLAKTLARLGAEGPDAIYRGEVAAEFVDVARAHGSQITLEDLEAYRVAEREPLRVRFGAREIVTMPLPSAGGLLVAELAKLYSPEELRSLGASSPGYQHLLAEGIRGALADRMRYLGDGDQQKIDLAALTSDARMARRRASIALDRTHALPRFGLEESGTHHLVTADRQGNVVSLTTTVNRLFGAKLVAERSGVVLNDELDDFTPRSAIEPFGMTESPNRPRPGARPLSSMTPTLVFEQGRPVLALGGSGGMAIGSNVAQVLLGCLVFEQSPARAVAAPRIFVPTQTKTLLVEKTTSAEHIRDLERRGEIVGILPDFATAVQAMDFTEAGVRAGADPRKHGEAISE